MYSALHDPTAWSLPRALAEHAASKPDATWVEIVDGESLNFGAADRDARQVANFIAGQGVAAGERIALMLPNGLDFVRAWMGLGYGGVTAVLLNTELRGAFLLHQINNCGARLAIVDAALLGALRKISGQLQHLRRVLVVGAALEGGTTDFEIAPWESWREAPPNAPPPPAPQDVSCVMYTSGTSGPANGLLMQLGTTLIADPETDRPLPPGTVGEILVRPKTAWGFMAGYLDLPEKTVESWRNLWFHTGDAAVMDADGGVTFVDRIKD